MKITKTIEQINFLDERFYTVDNINYYPSVTYILDAYPKGFGYQQWLKDLGHNADIVRDRAGAQGTVVHDGIHALLMGEELEWNEATFDLEAWLHILRFADFWQSYEPVLIATEHTMLSEALGYGGTIDLVCKINGAVWMIDCKTSNALHNSYELQLAAYRQMWDEQMQDKIDKCGIFWPKAKTKGSAKNKIQGEGWKIEEYTDYESALSLFNATKQIWQKENPNPKPKNKSYPTKISLEL